MTRARSCLAMKIQSGKEVQIEGDVFTVIGRIR